MITPELRLTRRSFLGWSGAVMVGAVTGQAGRLIGVNPRVRVAVLGLGERGISLAAIVRASSDAQLIAMFDPNPARIDIALSRVDPFTRGMCVHTARNLEALFADEDMDAVLIAAPVRMRADLVMEACRAGKHVYVDGPVALHPSDGERVEQMAVECSCVLDHGALAMHDDMSSATLSRIRKGSIGSVRNATLIIEHRVMGSTGSVDWCEELAAIYDELEVGRAAIGGGEAESVSLRARKVESNAPAMLDASWQFRRCNGESVCLNLRHHWLPRCRSESLNVSLHITGDRGVERFALGVIDCNAASRYAQLRASRLERFLLRLSDKHVIPVLGSKEHDLAGLRTLSMAARRLS